MAKTTEFSRHSEAGTDKPMVAQTDLISSVNEPQTTTLGLWEQIKEDWIAHGRDWTKPGFRAVAVQRFGVWRMKIEPKLLRAPLAFSTVHYIAKFAIPMGLSYLTQFR